MTHLSNTEILCFVLGYQGGTVHQVAKELMVCPESILGADAETMRDLCRVAQRARVVGRVERGRG